MSLDSSVNYRIWACVPTKMAPVTFSEVAQTSPISHFKAETNCYPKHLTQKKFTCISRVKMTWQKLRDILWRNLITKYIFKPIDSDSIWSQL